MPCAQGCAQCNALCPVLRVERSGLLARADPEAGASQDFAAHRLVAQHRGDSRLVEMAGHRQIQLRLGYSHQSKAPSSLHQRRPCEIDGERGEADHRRTTLLGQPQVGHLRQQLERVELDIARGRTGLELAL